jgi:hypothetical protein
MSANSEIEKNHFVDTTNSIEGEIVEIGGSSEAIYVDSEKEKAVFRKFDKYVIPASFTFMVLCALDRNNVRITVVSVYCMELTTRIAG